MQKLTNEKARELLKELQYAKVQMGGQLSIRDEYFKQALEHVVKGVPDGWKLVPVEPTKEMLEEIWLDERFKELAMKRRYQALLAAAPEAPL